MTDPNRTTTRRNAILGGIAAGTTAWVAPAILTVDAAAAASGDTLQVTVTSLCNVEVNSWRVEVYDSMWILVDSRSGGPGGPDTFTLTFSGLAPGTYNVVAFELDPEDNPENERSDTVTLPPDTAITLGPFCQPG